jgi:uncharacterized RDD family membrane protein YckC
MAQANAVPVSGSKLDNRRVLAALIDLVVVGAGWGVILAAAGMLGEGPSGLGAPLVGVMLAWALYYYFACESGSGQTLGKRVTNIRVVRVDGRPAGMREITLRTVLRLIDMQFFYLVGLIVMLGTRERRGRLGDLVAGTMIVSADQAAPASVATPAPAAEVSRVPIAESGPAFAPTPEDELAADEAAAEDESADLTSPALQELASDVAATAGSAPDEVEEAAVEAEPVAEEPVAEEEPAVEEPAVEVLADQPFAEDEPAADEPVEDEPGVDEEPAVDDEPAVDEEPAAEEAPASEGEPAAEEEPAVEREAAAEQETAEVEAVEDEAASEQDEEEVTVRSVETVSAIDLVMDDSRRNS